MMCWLRRLWLVLALISLVPVGSWAAVVHQSTTTFLNNIADTSHTESVTVSSGSNRVLIVGVGIEDAANTVSTLTNDGTGLTFHSRHACTPVSTIEWWYQINPPVATANVVITLSGSEQFSGGITVVTGAHQTTPLGTAVYADAGGTCGSAANPSVTITDGATGDLVIDLVMESLGGNTVGAGQTERYANTCLASYCAHGSTEPGASSVTMSWTQGASDRHLGAVNIFQSAGGAAPVPSGALLGVGP
jgi:hypothetical protein